MASSPISSIRRSLSRKASRSKRLVEIDTPEDAETWRVCIFGGFEIGKTTFARAFTGFSKGDKRSVLSKTITVDGRPCCIFVMDSMYYDEFESQVFPSGSKRPRDADGFIIMYSITNRGSFARLECLVSMVHSIGMWRNKRLPCIIVGTKCDVESERQVSVEEAAQFAQSEECGCPFFEVSGESGHNVPEVFEAMVREMRAEALPSSQSGAGGVVLRVDGGTKRRLESCVVM